MNNINTIANEVIRHLNKNNFTTDKNFYVSRAYSNQYEIDFETYDLKIGGEDDIDANDSSVFRNIVKLVKSFFNNYYSDIEIVDIESEYKGGWSLTIRKKMNKKSQRDYNRKLSNANKIKNKISKYENELLELNKKITEKIQKQSAKFKTCPNCGSKISKEYIKNHKCNVCNKELYTNTEQKKVDNINLKIQKAKKELNNL
jgi:hypothetical protein